MDADHYAPPADSPSDANAAAAVAVVLDDHDMWPGLAPHIVTAVREADRRWEAEAPQRALTERIAREADLPPDQREAARFMRVVTSLLAVCEHFGIDSSAIWESAEPTEAEHEALSEYRAAEYARWSKRAVEGTDWLPSPSMGGASEWRARYVRIVGVLLSSIRHPDWQEIAPGMAERAERSVTDEDRAALDAV